MTRVGSRVEGLQRKERLTKTTVRGLGFWGFRGLGFRGLGLV